MNTTHLRRRLSALGLLSACVWACAHGAPHDVEADSATTDAAAPTTVATGATPGSSDPASTDPAAESTYFTVEHFVPPAGVVLEVGGMDWLSDGRLAVSTRRGQVWFIENALAEDVRDARYELFAEGLHEGLGLHVMRGEGAGGSDRIFVLQRGELTELRDTDADGRADSFRTVADGWGLSGNYHEFAFGLPRLADGRLGMSLNVSFFSPDWWVGKSTVPYRGWALAVDPESGEIEPLMAGFRSPCGVATDADGRLLITDNQGDWMPVCGVWVVEPGAFASHPSSLDWTEDFRRNGLKASEFNPPSVERTPPALWLPYGWSRSTGNLLVDRSGGLFQDQLLISEMTNGNLLRAELETVQGVTQGASFLMRRDVGSVTRLLQADDGSLLCGLTNRGWGGLAPADGLARVRSTGVDPFEVHSFRVAQDGFVLSFTEPLDEATADALRPEALALSQYDYDYWWEYGSPERNTHEVAVDALSWNDARDELRLTARGLQPGFMVRLLLPELSAASGRPLLHRELSYTLHRMPGRAAPEQPIAKIAEVPPPRATADEGWLRLSYGDATHAWESIGWELVNAAWSASTPTEFQIDTGNNALVPTAPDASAYRARWDLASGEYEFGLMLAEDAQLRVELDGAMSVALSTGEPADGTPNGSLDDGLGTQHVPGREARLIPGQWHTVRMNYERRPEGSILHSFSVDDVLWHADLSLAPPATPGFELARSAGAVALGSLRFKAAHPGRLGEGWLALFTGDDLGSWVVEPPFADPLDTDWEVDAGMVITDGARRLATSARDDYRDIELSARLRVNDRGTGALVLRSDAQGKGYAITINATADGPERTGSLRGLTPIPVHLAPPGTWTFLRARVADESEGTRVQVWLNGVQVLDHLDTQRRHAAGRLGILHDHETTRLRVDDLRIRELPGD